LDDFDVGEEMTRDKGGEMNQYKQGFIDGLRAFAWWKNGQEVLSTSETSLKETINNVEKVWNYDPVFKDEYKIPND
jgi:hypothetical protein